MYRLISEQEIQQHHLLLITSQKKLAEFDSSCSKNKTSPADINSILSRTKMELEVCNKETAYILKTVQNIMYHIKQKEQEQIKLNESKTNDTNISDSGIVSWDDTNTSNNTNTTAIEQGIETFNLKDKLAEITRLDEEEEQKINLQQTGTISEPEESEPEDEDMEDIPIPSKRGKQQRYIKNKFIDDEAQHVDDGDETSLGSSQNSEPIHKQNEMDDFIVNPVSDNEEEDERLLNKMNGQKVKHAKYISTYIYSYLFAYIYIVFFFFFLYICV